MNKIYNCKNNLPVYIGNYPGGRIVAPGLKPRRTQFYYEIVKENVNNPNFDKILKSESNNPVIETNLEKERKKITEQSTQSNESQPINDLAMSGGSKRKFHTLFKVS